MEQDQNSAQPISDAAIEQNQAPDTPSQMVAPPVSDAPMEQDQNSAQIIAQPFSNAAIQNLPKIQFLSKRRNDDSRVMIARRNTHANAPRAVTEKTRLVEQLDLTTRKIMDHKDSTISELQAQV
jgi:hypothetical protein